MNESLVALEQRIPALEAQLAALTTPPSAQATATQLKAK
jgi:hypothetical protein